MNATVLFQTLKGTERLLTSLTFVRIILNVFVNVHLQAVREAKGLLTQFTLVWLFTRMDPRVTLQLASRWKHFSACLTLVAFLFGVGLRFSLGLRFF